MQSFKHAIGFCIVPTYNEAILRSHILTHVQLVPSGLDSIPQSTIKKKDAERKLHIKVHCSRDRTLDPTVHYRKIATQKTIYASFLMLEI